MITFQAILAEYPLYIFTVFFIIYLIGKPRMLIQLVNKLWTIEITKYNISLFALLSLIFAFGGLNNYFNYYHENIELKSILELGNQDIHYSDLIERKKKFIYLYERGIFLYLTFFIMTLLFVKFSNVYQKKFALEDKLSELTIIKKNSSEEKSKSKEKEKAPSNDDLKETEAGDKTGKLKKD